jgi:hypothetical protein
MGLSLMNMLGLSSNVHAPSVVSSMDSHNFPLTRTFHNPLHYIWRKHLQY